MNKATETEIKLNIDAQTPKTPPKNPRLICFCNDDQLCPDKQLPRAHSDPHDPHITQNQSYLEQTDPSLLTFLNQTKLKLRVCESKTMCLTKKLQKRSGEYWLKYSCDHSSLDGLRGSIIKFRDCKIDTDNLDEKAQVISKSAEFCCDQKPFCNIDLVPKKSLKDLLDYSQSTSKSIEHQLDPNTSAPSTGPLNIFNLVLSCFSIGVFLISLFLFIFYMYKKFKLETAKIQFKSQMYNTTPTPAPLNTTSSSSHATSTTSTTNTSINSKENSLNQSDYNFNFNLKHQIYANEARLKLKLNQTSGELFEPFLPHHLSEAIKINSPLSTTTNSSGFVSTNVIEIESPQSPSELEWSGSGSGAGFPQCVQRTIARQIKLIYPCIGKGRFGEVYKGEWRGEFVAVKTFNSADEKSWENECNIYNTSGFRHENILGFIAADNIDRGLYTELWLITEFHANGSLYDYLSENQINPDLCLKMALSIVNGLVHLHMPIESCKGKPALAHCDLKSKNILVKSDLSCCIGDLGLALSGDKDGKVAQGGNIRTGTKRYMAPEILSKRIDTRYLDAFQKAEMYSLGLVLWELLRSVRFEDDVSKAVYSFEYKMPFYEYIQNDPDEALMVKIVCEEKLRPCANDLWAKNVIMSELFGLAEELWVEMPNERLNALRLKKSLTKLKTSILDR